MRRFSGSVLALLGHPPKLRDERPDLLGNRQLPGQVERHAASQSSPVGFASLKGAPGLSGS